MEARAIAKHIRVSPQKARLVADLVRNKRAGDALQVLKVLPQKAARLIKKVLESAIANADQNPNIDVDTLYIKKLLIDKGPQLKRIHPRAQGRAFGILHRLAHITIILDEA